MRGFRKHNYNEEDDTNRAVKMIGVGTYEGKKKSVDELRALCC